jgi:transposase
VYWIAPHEVLERHGFELVLVNTRELARVPGRKKTDRVDCKWIQRLHSCGLLTGSFRPNEAVCMLRTLVRDKGTLVAEASDWLRRMQKSLDQMNVRVLTTGAGAWSALSRIRCAFRCASGQLFPTSTE